VEDQCVSRIHRIGQSAKVVRVRKFVVNESVEERIVLLQRRKKDMACMLNYSRKSLSTSLTTFHKDTSLLDYIEKVIGFG